MESTRRGFMKALGAASIGGFAGCSSGNYKEEKEEEADLYDIVDGIKYDQKHRLGDHNVDSDKPAYNPETLEFNTNPEKILESSEDIDYMATVRTHEEGPFRDMTSFPEDYCCDGSPIASGLAEMVAQNLWFPLKNSEGGSAGYVEAGKEFKERMGSISAEVKDHEGNTAEVTMPQSTAEEYWEKIEEHYIDEEWEELQDLSREMTTWAEENMETTF